MLSLVYLIYMAGDKCMRQNACFICIHFFQFVHHCQTSTVFTPQPFRAVGVLFSPIVSGWAGEGEKFVRAVSQIP